MMSNITEKSWKNRLQEYCQKNKLRLPNYRIRQQSGVPNELKFQVEVEVDGRWYTGEENCSSKKDAEHSAAQKACADVIGNNSLDLDTRGQPDVDSAADDNDLSKHLPPEYADVEEYIANMVGAFGGRIRKVRPLGPCGRYKIEITGNYRYCDNIKGHHKKNQVYFLVDPIKKIYYQRCYDPDCQGFQSAIKHIYTSQVINNPANA